MFKMFKTMLIVFLGLAIPTITCTAAQSPAAGGAGAPAARELSPAARAVELRRAAEERLRLADAEREEAEAVYVRDEVARSLLAEKLEQFRLALVQEGKRLVAERELAQTPMLLGDLSASPASRGGASTVAVGDRSGSVSPVSPTALRLVASQMASPSPMSPRHPRRVLEREAASSSTTASPR